MLAFPKIACRYDLTLPHLSFICVSHDYQIPICYYIKDKTWPYVIYSHANAETIGDFDIEALSEVFHANMLMYDYAGYGLHTCKQSSEAHAYKDIENVYQFLVNQGVPCERIVLYGRSIGTGVAAHMALLLSQQQRCCKLILVSPFKSVIQVVANWPNAPFDILRIDKMAPLITCQVLIIHGCRDVVTPHHQSKSLSLLFPNLYDFKTIHKCGHHNLYLQPEYYESIHKFIL